MFDILAFQRHIIPNLDKKWVLKMIFVMKMKIFVNCFSSQVILSLVLNFPLKQNYCDPQKRRQSFELFTCNYITNYVKIFF